MPGENRFAGLPEEQALSHASSVGDTYRARWTLPKKHAGMRWKSSGLDDKYLSFELEELTPEMQHQAAKISKDNPSILQQELLFRSVVVIGDRKVASDREFKEVWYRAIGPKCRQLLSAAFGEIVSVDEADTESFLAQNADAAE